jgi:prepilin-type N-terminal cleavage/methylation domain-containing protein/prepilin-type processing-associated H-X9-DG protein
MQAGRSRSHGFTLIELLVVIAIIAILAAILFPVFAQARAKARQVTCLSNQKQIGIAIMTYAQDFDEMFPYANYDVPPPAGNIIWPYLIDPYVKSGIAQQNIQRVGTDTKNVWYCPNYLASYPGGIVADPLKAESSYVANSNVMAACGAGIQGSHGRPCSIPGSLTPLALAAVQAPAQLVIVAEFPGGRVWTTGHDTALCEAITSPERWAQNRAYCAARGRHTGGSNHLLADGHAKWYRAPEVWNAESLSGVCWRASTVTPPKYANCQAWFREN